MYTHIKKCIQTLFELIQNCCVWVASKLTPHHHPGCWQPLLWPPGTWPPLTEPLSALLRQPICLKTGNTCSTSIQCFFIGNTDTLITWKSSHIKYFSCCCRTYISNVMCSAFIAVWSQTKERDEKNLFKVNSHYQASKLSFIVWNLTGEFPQQEEMLVHRLLRKKTHTQPTFLISSTSYTLIKKYILHNR